MDDIRFISDENGHSRFVQIDMKSITIVLFCSIFIVSQGITQHNVLEKPFSTIHTEISLLPISKNLFIQESAYDDYVTSVGFYTKIANNWYGGLYSYQLLLLLDGANVLRYTQPFFISNLFARHYFSYQPVNAFWESSFGVGNLCSCRPQFSNIITARNLYRLDKAGFYLGAAIGLDIRINNYVTLKPNLKAFYLLNDIKEKSIHFRPFLTFQITRKANPPSVIYNPRF